MTDGLRVRSKPEVGEASKLLTPLLDAGREVFVVAGPVRASGYSWYQVQPLAKVAEFEGLPFGWVAATGKDGEPWLASVPLTCPALPEDYAAFVALRPLVALSCFGDDDLTFAARLASPEATCGVEIDWTVEPDWLGSTCPHPTFLLADADRDDSTRDAILDPTMDVADLPQPGVEPADWIDILVTGHFDHVAARSCRVVSHESVVLLESAAVVLGCRTQFVLTYIEPSGYLPGPDA